MFSLKTVRNISLILNEITYIKKLTKGHANSSQSSVHRWCPRLWTSDFFSTLARYQLLANAAPYGELSDGDGNVTCMSKVTHMLSVVPAPLPGQVAWACCEQQMRRYRPPACLLASRLHPHAAGAPTALHITAILNTRHE